MRNLILAILLGASLTSQAQLLIEHQQIEMEPSYFVSFDHDTIYGDIEYGKSLFGGLLTKIFYIDEEGYRYKLRANESNGFSLNGQNYESKLIDDFFYFLRPAVQGKPALYYLENNFSKRNDPSLEMIRVQSSHGRILKSYVEVNGRMKKVYRKRFKRQAVNLFAAYPDIVEMVFEDELGFYDLEEIVTYCNAINDGLINSEYQSHQ